MNNLVILYNPYYQSDVIQQHLQVLIDKELVAFGKIRSKIKTVEHGFEEQLNAIYDVTDDEKYLQLFLTDYSNLFVAQVINVTNENMSHIAPTYYKEKDLEVEKWFVIKDIKELVRGNFISIRDNYLSNFTTPNFHNHTYAIYGNSYVYPLIVNMKQKIDYFEKEDKEYKHYPNVYKTKEFLEIKYNLITYSFGSKYINFMHPNTLENIISAEIEYQQNKDNPLYDFSSVVVKYTKTIEQELYMFFKAFIDFLSKENKSILDIEYKVQSFEYALYDIFTHKPNLGTYKYLLTQKAIKDELRSRCNKQIQFYISRIIPSNINTFQEIRNETVHGNPPSLKDVELLRDKILGIGCESMIVELVKTRNGNLG